MSVRMSGWLRRATAVLALAFVTTVPAAVVAGPALAVGCYRSSCNHYDPQTMGCSPDAYSLAVINPEGSYDVQLRYSPACGAAWARITNTGSGYPVYKYLKLQVWSAKTGGTLLWTETKYNEQLNNDQNYWTAMGSYQYWVQACVKNSDDWGHCTARY
jgi:hypothetical protein